jgi:hypothetical protein
VLIRRRHPHGPGRPDGRCHCRLHAAVNGQAGWACQGPAPGTAEPPPERASGWERGRGLWSQGCLRFWWGRVMGGTHCLDVSNRGIWPPCCRPCPCEPAQGCACAAAAETQGVLCGGDGGGGGPSRLLPGRHVLGRAAEAPAALGTFACHHHTFCATTWYACCGCKKADCHTPLLPPRCSLLRPPPPRLGVGCWRGLARKPVVGASSCTLLSPCSTVVSSAHCWGYQVERRQSPRSPPATAACCALPDVRPSSTADPLRQAGLV